MRFKQGFFTLQTRLLCIPKKPCLRCKEALFTGKRSLVAPMSMAAAAAGADGIMIEVHTNPQEALCDGPQALTPADFETLMKSLTDILPH